MDNQIQQLAVIIIIATFITVFVVNDTLAQAVSDNKNAENYKSESVSQEQYSNENEVSQPVNSNYDDYDETEPVDLSADNLIHDDTTQTITASGNVELKQSGRTITADEISYNLDTDTVIASGNIVIHELNGDVYYADKVQLTNKMRDGYVKSLRSYLADGGIFTADSGVRENESIITMENASYTACDCETDKDGDPAWALKAESITYNEAEHDISYKNAWFEIFGVPVAFTPYFIHSDGKVKRKSGFLSPQLGYDSQLGFVVTPRYYWDIAPNKDATFSLMFMNNEPPVFLTEYRHRFARAHINFDGSVGYSERTESDAGLDVEKDEELRGHIFSEGRWDINQKWRAGFDIALTTDDQYLRQFDISGEDILENDIYLERFSGRNYSSIRALAFQDTRIRNESRDFDQPNILPEIFTKFLGEPNQLLGGRWSLEFSALGLNRKDGEQDMERLSTELGWEKKFVSNLGLLLTSNISAIADFYHVNDKTDATPGSGRSTSGSTTRTFVQSHNVLSYPLINTFERSHLLIEPKVAFTLAPNIDVSDTDIPNEDSQDVQLDTSNLFESNRFPGRDRLEDKSRVTFGMTTGLYDFNGSKIDFFIGQSYRLDDDDNPFSDGSGLDEQASDVVGQLSVIYNNFNLNYRFQLDDHNLSSQRHELDSYIELGNLKLSNSYLFAKALEGTSTDESREQLSTSAQFRFNRNWNITGTSRYDLGDEPGLRKASVGINYIGCCLGIGLRAQRNLTSDASGDSSTDVTFRIGLKNIGEFASGGDSFGMYSAGYDE